MTLVLPDAAALDAVPVDQLPEVIGALEALKARAWARLAVVPGPALPPSAATPPYSLTEAATLLGKSPAWVRRQARAGILPGRKVGKSWVFTREDFDRARRRTRLGT